MSPPASYGFGPYPAQGLYLGAFPDLLVALSALTVTAMSLGMLVSVRPRRYYPVRYR